MKKQTQKKVKNPQTSREDFSFGSKAWNEFYHGRNKDKKTPRKHEKLTPAQIRNAQSAEDDRYSAELEEEFKKNLKKYGKILGPTLNAQAVKIARQDMMPFDFLDVDAFREAGWNVVGAGQIQARRNEPIKNPPPLSEGGTARALVLLREEIRTWHLDDLLAKGYDVFPAPKAYREGVKKNPAKKKAVKNPYGDHKAEEKAALAKAHAFFGDGPHTGAKELKGYVAPGAAVEIGEFVALEYDSKKFDGESRIYRHDATKKRKLYISIDGSTLIVWPPLRLTKRGIEG